MLAVLDRRQRVRDAGRRMTGRIDRDVERRMRDQRLRVVAHPGRAAFRRVARRPRRHLLRRPSDARQGIARPGGIEVGDTDDVQAARAARLRQEHGAELAGADQSDAQRFACGVALQQQPVQIHRRFSVKPRHPAGCARR
jgi:hypothetical protein